MNSTASAFAFLIVHTTRNRVARQVARVKSPRYLLALLVGGLYFWTLIARRPAAAGAPGIPGVNTTLETMVEIALALTMIAWWVFGKVNSALAFQPAEVQFLFPAPVSRRELIAYKVVRSQIVLLINALVWTVLLRRFNVSVDWPMRFATAWAVFSILSLHRLGTALVQTEPVTGVRRFLALAGKGVALAVAFGLVAGLAPALLRFRELGFEDGFRGLGTAVTSPPAAYALAPFRLLLDPLYAATPGAWFAAFGIVVGIVVLHVVWVLSMDVDFQEAAAGASVALATRMAAFKARRGGGPAMVQPGKKTKDWLPLAPKGRPAVAIVWKNTLALTRTGSGRGLVLVIVLVVVTLRLTFAHASAHGEVGPLLVLPYALIAAMIFLMGPRALRNDLRQDLLNLASLKSYPISGTELVAAEMASPTLVLTALQLVLLIAGYFAMSAVTRASLGGGLTTAAVILVPIGCLVLNAASIAIQNGAALLFPGWVRLGPDSAGIEAMGQNLLVTFGSLFSLLLGLIAPAIIGGGIGFLLQLSLDSAGTAVGISVGAAAGIAVLIFEVALAVRLLGGAFERIDPTALA